MLAAFKAEHDNLKLCSTRREARVAHTVRSDNRTDKSKMTVGEVDAIVTLDPQVQEYGAYVG